MTTLAPLTGTEVAVSTNALPVRQSTLTRRTEETSIDLHLVLDGEGRVQAATGVPFLDHMLQALGRHARFDLTVTASGDAAMDPHHTVEDVGIVLGQTLRSALGDRAGIARFGSAYAPLDEALARVVVDCSGRPFLHFAAEMPEASIGADFASSLVEEFWRALATNGGLTMHVDLIRSRNAHHAAEAIFKAAAVAMRQAFERTGPEGAVPSTKGVLA
ncbi:MAG: Imidazoleglycerol-phosphate dehydratase [uncultured Thermomicrobiales bacterium]|uniref:Imidazoleglycerol-phosphate dehydratase n=1 Tax=uncultured Thermomicrobiales bacterium TaxID=1645740 RepID=A0A6J4V8F2_9BACT|nr:MAG: Imidazoleglycerol-phosphate dehydratase [uncultured Thermomicrobiales bacterium]